MKFVLSFVGMYLCVLFAGYLLIAEKIFNKFLKKYLVGNKKGCTFATRLKKRG
jgi:hypothetical protein